MKFNSVLYALMHTLVVTILLLFISTKITGQTNWNFAAPTDGAGSSSAETGRAICADASGNIYVLGNFNGTPDFDLSSSTTNTSTAVGGQDGYVVSYDKNGAFRWKATFTGTGNEFGAPGGAICTNGTFVWIAASANTSGTAQAISAAGTIAITTSGTASVDIVISKLNCSNGAVQWVTVLGGAGSSEFGEGIAADPKGDCYAIGCYNATFTVNGITAPVPSGATDVFIAKLATDGKLIRLVTGGGAGADMIVNGGGVCYVPGVSPSIVAVGSYNGNGSFGSTSLTNSGATGSDCLLLELDTTLNYTNVLGFGSGTNNEELLGVAYDPFTKDVFICGYFNGASVTLPGTSALSQSGGADAIFARYSVSSNNFVWARTATGSSTERPYAVAADGRGGVLMSGSTASTSLDFGGSVSVTGGTSISNDVFVVKFLPNGTPSWGLSAGSTGNDEARGVASYVETTPALVQNVLVYGIYSGAISFNGTSLSNDGGNDFFVAKINDQTNLLPLHLLSFTGRRMSNTINNLSWETADELNTKEFIIEKSDNGNNFSMIGTIAAKNNNLNNEYSYEERNVMITAYYRLKMIDIDGSYTYSNIIRVSGDDMVADAYIFPNPVERDFQLHVTDQFINTKAIITSMNGQVVKALRVNDRNINVNIQDLVPGIYTLKLVNGKAFRLVKK